MGWIGVDLDGTLAHYDGWKGSDHVGAPIPAMVERVKRWLAAGKDVRIFTARADNPEKFPAIREFLLENGLPLLPITNVKDFTMEMLWDDRCVQVEANTGNRVDGKTDDYLGWSWKKEV